MANKTEKIVVFDLSVNVEGIEKELAKIKAKTTELKLENRELQKSLEQAISEGATARIKSLSASISENETQLKILNTQYSQYNSTLQKTAQQEKAKAGSYEELLREYELGVVQLKLQMDAIKKNEKGEYELTEAYKKASAELKKKKDAIDQFNKGIGDNRSLVGSYTDAIKEAFADGGALSNQFGALASGARLAGQATQVFGNGLNGISTALKANPLGLLLEGFRFLKDLIAKNNTLTELFAGYMSALNTIIGGLTSVFFKLGSIIGSVFSEPQKILEFFVDYIDKTVIQYVKGLGNILKGVFTLDFDTIKQGVGEVGGAYKNAVQPALDGAKAVGEFANSLADQAKRAFELSQRTEALEDKERSYKEQLTANKLEVENLIKQAKERTESEEDRLALLNKASELEKQNLAKELEIAEERANIIKGENKLLDERGQLTDEQRDKEASANAEVIRLRGESANKEQEIENRKAKLIIEINKEILNKKKSFLDSELALLEAQGKSTIAKQREIAKQELDIALQDAGDNAQAKETAQNLYEAKLLNIRKSANDKYRAIAEERKNAEIEKQTELDDALLLLIEGSSDRQIAQILLDGKRRLEAIKSTGEERKIIEQGIAFDIANQLAEVNQQIADEELAKKQETIEANANAIREARTRRNAEEENAIKLALSNQEITEQEANIRRLENQKRNAEAELQLVTSTSLAKAVALEQSIQTEKDLLQRQLNEGKITQEAYNQELKDIEAQAITDRITLKTETDSALLTAEVNYQTAVTDAQVNANAQRLEDEKNTAEAKKKIQEEVINATSQSLQALAGLLSKDEESRKKNAKLLKAIAIAEVGINAFKEISGYWEGAGKDAGKSGVYGGIGATVIAGVLTASAIARSISAISKITSTGTFAQGGYTGDGMPMVDRTGFRIAGLVHEGEYVVPKWMMMNTSIAPIISSLESIRRTKNIKGYADGGFTSAFRLAKAVPTMNEETIANAFDGAIKKVQIVASADEITSTQTIQTNILDGATI